MAIPPMNAVSCPSFFPSLNCYGSESTSLDTSPPYTMSLYLGLQVGAAWHSGPRHTERPMAGTWHLPWLLHCKCHSVFQSGLFAFVSRDLLVAFTTGVSGSYLTCWLLSTVKVQETVHVTPLRRTLASSLQSECGSCLQCFDTVGWAAGRASGL